MAAMKAPFQAEIGALFPTVMRTLTHLPVPTQSRFLAIACAMIERFLDANESKWSSRLGVLTTPLHLLAGVASETAGRTLAVALVNIGRTRCLKMAADVLNMSTAEARAAAESENYDGPLCVFTQPRRWAALATIAKSETENALWTSSDPEVVTLRGSLMAWYAPVSLTQDDAEGAIKDVKSLSPTQRASITTVERAVRERRNRHFCLVRVPAPNFPFLPTDLWKPISDSTKEEPTSPRLAFSQNNPGHLALPALTRSSRKLINRELGFNKKRTRQEREQAKAQVQLPVQANSHAALLGTLRTHFARALFPAEPEVDADGRLRKKRKTKRQREQRQVHGKDEKMYDDDFDYEED